MRFPLFLLALAVSFSLSARTVQIRGTVRDAGTGAGIADVVVSDGRQCVLTAKNGTFRFKSDDEVAANIFVVVPSEYEVPMTGNHLFGGFIPVDAATRKYDFSLSRRTQACDHYLMLMMGDPQAMSQRPHSLEANRYIWSRMAEYAKSATLPLYQTLLGDMVTNEIEVPGRAESFMSVFAQCGIPSFALPGNHDHVQKAPTYREAISQFARHFGPYNYAVNIGKVHYIFVDNCAWCHTRSKKFSRGLNDEALAFVKADLQYVDKSTPLMICMHCPQTKGLDGAFYRVEVNKQPFIEALEGRNVHMWYGHTHMYANYVYSPEELASHAPGVSSLESHLVGRCDGCWAWSGVITEDGVPRGPLVVEVDGTDIRWNLHTVDPDFEDDFSYYVPGRFTEAQSADPKALYCNVYLWDSTWGTPEWWVNGRKVAQFERVVTGRDATIEPYYAKLFPEWETMGVIGFRKVEYPRTSNCMHLFKVLPEEGVREGEIHLTDRWGRSYVRKVRW